MRNEKDFLKVVESMVEGQLLQTTFEETLVADSTQTFDFIAPIGRGDIVAFQPILITADINTLRLIFVSVSINGKVVNENLPGLALGFDFQALGQVAVSPGTQRLQKTIYKVPEGARVSIKIVSGPIGDTNIIVNGFLTDKFLPIDGYYSLVQYFELEALTGVFNSKRFEIPSARGRVVGLSLFVNAEPSSFQDFQLGADVRINGIVVVENYSPFIYNQTSQTLRVNNWVVNIAGGGNLVIETDLSGGAQPDFSLGVVLYFNDRLPSKRPVSERSKQLPVTTE